MLGGLVFRALEHSDSTQRPRANELDVERRSLQREFNISESRLKAFEELARKRKTNPKDWDYYQSLYFASTVTTTIGLCNFYPSIYFRFSGQVALLPPPSPSKKKNTKTWWQKCNSQNYLYLIFRSFYESFGAMLFIMLLLFFCLSSYKKQFKLLGISPVLTEILYFIIVWGNYLTLLLIII